MGTRQAAPRRIREATPRGQGRPPMGTMYAPQEDNEGRPNEKREAVTNAEKGGRPKDKVGAPHRDKRDCPHGELGRPWGQGQQASLATTTGATAASAPRLKVTVSKAKSIPSTVAGKDPPPPVESISGPRRAFAAIPMGGRGGDKSGQKGLSCRKKEDILPAKVFVSGINICKAEAAHQLSNCRKFCSFCTYRSKYILVR
jgi:hypothetical protein